MEWVNSNSSSESKELVPLEISSKRLEKTHYISELLKTTKDEDIETIILLLRGTLYPDWDKRKMGVASKLVLKAINTASGSSISAPHEPSLSRLASLLNCNPLLLRSFAIFSIFPPLKLMIFLLILGNGGKIIE